MNILIPLVLFLTVLPTSLIKDWKVGDTATYRLHGVFFQGWDTRTISFKSEKDAWIKESYFSDNGTVIVTDSLVDENGTVLKIYVDGEERELPKNDLEIILKEEETEITVDAGTFKAHYKEVLHKNNNLKSKYWTNPNLIPSGGLIKAVYDNGFLGESIIELVSFEKK